MPPVLDPDTASRLTKPFHALWIDSYRLAEKRMRTLREFDSDAFLAYEAPTIARMMRDHTVRGVRLGDGVGGSDSLGTYTQIINSDESSLLVRFKELDRDLRRFNHKSGRQDRLDRHEFEEEEIEQLEFDGLRHVPTLLSCGYVRDLDIVTISRVVVVCHWGRNPVWSFDLESGALQQIIQLPNIEEPPQTAVVSRIKKGIATAEDA
jgi:hypothetical protein